MDNLINVSQLIIFVILVLHLQLRNVIFLLLFIKDGGGERKIFEISQ